MAKRTPVVEEPYNPLDPLLAQSVIAGSSAPIPPAARYQDNRNGALLQVGPAATLRHRVLPMPAAQTSPVLEPSNAERRCREKRVVLSRSEERQIERLTDRMADELRTSLKLSHLLRAAVSVLLHAEEEIIHRLQGSAPLERPSNWDAVALAQFEHDLAKILSHALREAPPLR